MIEELAAAWVTTPRASVHASTGLNMGRQGTLAYWLVHMLAFVTGRLDAEGGNLKSDGFYPNARSGAGSPEQAYVDTEFGRLRRGALPGTLMADAILDSADPVRAMIVVAGNPLLSIAGGDRLRKAFEQLELLVVIDIYPSATAELADVVLPSTDMYERDDLNVVNIGTSARPFVQYTPAVVAPAGERRPEWWIAHRLLQALGEPSLLDDDEPDPWSKWRHMLARGSGVDLSDLQTTGDRRRPAGAGARRVLRAPGAHRRRPRRLLPAVVHGGDRTVPPPVHGGRARGRRRRAATDPRARRVDAQHVVRQRRPHEARRADDEPARHPSRRRRRARARRRRSGRRGQRARRRRDGGRARRRPQAGSRVDGPRLGPRGQPAACGWPPSTPAPTPTCSCRAAPAASNRSPARPT